MKAKQLLHWLVALTSGEYQQGRSQLKDGDEYCCLGVLADIAGAGKWKEHQGEEMFEYAGERKGGLLPLRFATARGIAARQGQLAAMNDHGDSFEKIAQYIGDHLDLDNEGT